MKRITLAVCLSALALFPVVLGADAAAQPPDRIDHYRFIPRRSVLEATGGFAGIEFSGNIHGEFDFITGFRHGPPDQLPPTLTPYAAFANVDAEADQRG